MGYLNFSNFGSSFWSIGCEAVYGLQVLEPRGNDTLTLDLGKLGQVILKNVFR